MIDREKLMSGLEYCETVGFCNECQYPTEWINENCPKCELYKDAAAEIREMTGEIEQLRAQVYNLTLYLSEAFFADGEVLMLLEQMHPGLPGFCPAEVFDDGKGPDAE